MSWSWKAKKYHRYSHWLGIILVESVIVAELASIVYLLESRLNVRDEEYRGEISELCLASGKVHISYSLV